MMAGDPPAMFMMMRRVFILHSRQECRGGAKLEEKRKSAHEGDDGDAVADWDGGDGDWFHQNFLSLFGEGWVVSTRFVLDFEYALTRELIHPANLWYVLSVLQDRYPTVRVDEEGLG